MEKTANGIHSWNSGEQLTSQDLNTIKSYLQELEQKLGQVITATSNDAEKSVIIGNEGNLELKTKQDTISNLSSIIKTNVTNEVMRSSGWPYDSIGSRTGLGAANSPSSSLNISSQSISAPLRDFILFGAASQNESPTENSPIPINIAGITGNISVVTCIENQNDEDGIYTAIPTLGGIAALPLTEEYKSRANVQDSSGNYYIADAIDLREKKYIKRLAYKRAYAKEISGSKYIALSNVEDSAPALSVGYNNLLCTHYASTPASSMETAPNLSIRYSKSGGSIFVKDIAHNTNLETAKQWFKENEIYILYILNEPIIIDLTDAQVTALSNLSSSNGAGRIFTTDSINPKMYIQYYLNAINLKTEIINSGVGAMVNIAEGYFKQAYDADTHLVYDTTHGLFAPQTTSDETGEENYPAIVCSQFSQAMIMGIKYNQSRYVKSVNHMSSWGYTTDGTGNYSYTNEDISDLPSQDYMVAKEQLRYAINHGWAYEITNTRRQIRPGDFIYWCDQEEASLDHITHVALCLHVGLDDNYMITLESDDMQFDTDNTKRVGVGTKRYAIQKEGGHYAYGARFPIGSALISPKLILSDKNLSGINEVFMIKQYTLDSEQNSGFYTAIIDGSFEASLIQIGVHYIDTATDVFNYNRGRVVSNAGRHAVTFYADRSFDQVRIGASANNAYTINQFCLFKGYYGQDWVLPA